MSDLVPVRRTDVNGKTVTRWVKSGADGKAAPRGIPMPKSKSRAEVTESVCNILFPSMDDETYPRNINGIATFFTLEFAEQSISLLPARTVKLLHDTLEELPDGKAKSMLAQTVYDHIREMEDMEGTAALKECVVIQNRLIANTCVFAESIEAISHAPGRYGKRSVSDLMGDMSRAVALHEGKTLDYLSHSMNDYSSLSGKSREEAQNSVMAHLLLDEFGAYNDDSPTDSHRQLVSEQRGNWNALTRAAMERGFSDPEMLSEILNSETPAISSGVL